MKAYEFQTTINKGIVEIPSDYLRLFFLQKMVKQRNKMTRKK